MDYQKARTTPKRNIAILLPVLAIVTVIGIAIGMIQLQRVNAASHAFGEEFARATEILRNCLIGLAGFALATSLIVLRLAGTNRHRSAAARSLRDANTALEAAEDLGRRRVAILEMIGRHAPLSQSLGAIAELAGARIPGAGAAVWSASSDALMYQVGTGLPDELVHILRSHTFERTLAERMAEANGLDCISLPLQTISGDSIGLLAIFSDRSRAGRVAGPPAELSSQMAQLATLAIESSLLYERLAFQAQHDILTGLPNRLLFQDRTQQAIRLAHRNKKKLAVLWIDVDRFKQVNDTLGHPVGDELLCEAARRLKHAIRDSDTTARVGGDEFVVLATDLESCADANVVSEKIMQALRRPMTLSGHEVRISVSIGIGIYPDHGAESATLMRSADLAMSQAKRAGRDAFRSFLPQFGVSLDRRLQLEQGLRKALDGGEFYLEYQPLIDRQDQLTAFETLLRWNSPLLGKVSPAEFIPVAEEAGAIGWIGEWVVRTACRQGARWLEAGIDVPCLSVNASGLQIADQEFTTMIRSALDESGFPASKLEIEVTETALVNNLECALDHITRLRKIGIKFAIDDFGTGYSSLNQLRVLPVDYVKVDRSFIKDLQISPTDTTTLVRGIIGLAHDLDLRVVAEGVETEQQLSLLRSMGCDLSQGFFLHRPMGSDAAEDLMKRYSSRAMEARVDPAPKEEDLVGAGYA